MSQDAREQARHIIETVQAYHDGKPIQVEWKSLPTWRDVNGEPDWNWKDKNYRVKPEERKPREIWVIFNEDGTRDAYESEQIVTRTGEPYPGQVHYREVLPETETE